MLANSAPKPSTPISERPTLYFPSGTDRLRSHALAPGDATALGRSRRGCRRETTARGGGVFEERRDGAGVQGLGASDSWAESDGRRSKGSKGAGREKSLSRRGSRKRAFSFQTRSEDARER